MDILRALILGAVQGATEFLPVSSSGHLKLGQSLLGLTEPQLLFDIVLHVGTLLSVTLFYRQDVMLAIRGIYQGLTGAARERSVKALIAPEGMRLTLLIILSTIPTGILGILFKKVLDPGDGEASFFTARMVCALLLVNGCILMSNAYFLKREQRTDTEEKPRREGPLSLWNISPWVALAIGVVQGMAVMPGISRSGMTITLALALMVQRLHAARYSFLLSIPAILGALVLKLKDMGGSTQGVDLGVFLAGAACAAVIGYICLIFLTKVLKQARFHHFAWYCWAVGIIGLIAL